jgi:sugar lactone lactonase YvrE
MATHAGRSYISCSGYKHEEGMDESVLFKPTGKLLMVDHKTGEGRVVAEGLKMPNGIAVTPDGKTLVLVDGFANRVLKYDIRPDGSLANQRLFADVGTPMDGMALDAEGGVWVATAAAFQYVDPDGKPGDAIEVPGFLCIAPMLGGEDGRTLFMAVTQHGSTDDIFAGKAKGQIVTTRVPVGAPG